MKLGTKLDKTVLDRTVKGPPPVVMQVQSTSYIRLEKPEELKQWEYDMQNFYGIKVPSGGMVGAGSESCSGGCSDDCDMC